MLTKTEDRYDKTKLYKVEEIIMFYSAYIETLKLCPFEKLLLNPKDLILEIPIDRTWEEAAQRDGYLDMYKHDKIKLAEDVLHNGTYFPIWVKRIGDKFKVQEGLHRVESIKYYIDSGNEWGYKLLSYTIPDTFYDKNNFKLFEAEIYFPVFNIEQNWHKNLFGHHCIKDEDVKEKYNSLAQDCPLLIKTHTLQDYIDAIFIWHKFLRHIFFKYESFNNDKIPVSKYINLERGDINAF